jgi:farnesyl diphosphate synthase
MKVNSPACFTVDALRGFLPRLQKDVSLVIATNCRMNGMPTSVSSRVEKYFQNCFEYNIVGGKLSRARTVIKAFECCSFDKNESSRKHAAVILGWCVEILQTFFLIEDDVMDHGETRRGKPCWYRHPDVGFANAINDGLFLEQLVYEIIETNEYTQQFSVEASSILRKASMRTVIGQHLDTHPPADVSHFSRDQWLSLVRFKTAFYTFLLPCELGILVSDTKFSQEERQKLKEVCLLIGELFQAQDDVLDCFGDPSVIGKVGRDIEEGKCTWLFYSSIELLRNDSELQNELKSLYGIPVKEPHHVKKIKEIYKSIEIEKAFEGYILRTTDKINKVIGQLESQSLKNLSKWVLDSIIDRKK